MIYKYVNDNANKDIIMMIIIMKKAKEIVIIIIVTIPVIIIISSSNGSIITINYHIYHHFITIINKIINNFRDCPIIIVTVTIKMMRMIYSFVKVT